MLFMIIRVFFTITYFFGKYIPVVSVYTTTYCTCYVFYFGTVNYVLKTDMYSTHDPFSQRFITTAKLTSINIWKNVFSSVEHQVIILKVS